MVPVIKTCWIIISLPITTLFYRNYELLSTVFIIFYFMFILSLINYVDYYMKQQKQINKMKLISFINDNIDEIEIDNNEIILSKLKELKRYYEGLNNYFINNTIKNELSSFYSKKEHSKMLNTIRQNYRVSNGIIKDELDKHNEIILHYKKCIDKLLKQIDDETNVNIIINNL